MRVVTKTEFNVEKNSFSEKIKKGSIFIHQTDTIYGLACNAQKSSCVQKIRDIKKRKDTPFSVIAPSKRWIYENCEVSKLAEKWIDKLPGPYTLILQLKNKKAISPLVNCDKNTLGVRMPKHWSTDIARHIEKPLITTSVNETGKYYMTSIDNLDPNIKKKIDFMIDEGEKDNRPSKLIDLTRSEAIIKER